MKRTIRCTPILLLLATLACAYPFDLLQSGGEVRLRARPEALEITNGTSARVYFFAVGATTAPLILWAPCVQPDTCRNVLPDETLSVSYEAVAGGRQESMIVYWWHLVPAGSGTFRFDSIRSQTVTLQ